jgi:hypothetical protein
VEKCLEERALVEAPDAARDTEVRGVRRARAWMAGIRRCLVAVRTLRLIVDIVVHWIKRGDIRSSTRTRTETRNWL